jgi:histidinol-phosphate phosphatase family protein
MNKLSLKIDKSWTLFLDRDGTINKKLEGDYVKKWEEFEFLPNVLIGLEKLSELFGHILIITNQQGVGKKIMSEDELSLIHAKMMDEIFYNQGRIDKIYFCPALVSENSENRKPESGMGLEAKKDFPDIDFSLSFMVGDSLSDMKFGKSLGMRTVFIANDESIQNRHPELIDHVFEDLLQFYNAVK